MSDKELNKYRFTSGEEPSDEMLDTVMKEVAEEATQKRNSANARFYNANEKEWEKLKEDYMDQIKQVISIK